jgi:dienelactone hydrolase
MRLKSIALALPLILAACASGPHEDVATAKPPIDKSLRMATAYPVALVNIAVEDPKAKSIPAALFQPAGTGPFPAVVILSGCAGVNADVSIVGRANRDYMSKGIVTLVVDSFTPRGLAEVCSDRKLLVESIAFRVRDAYAAVAWLGARPDVDPKRIFLQGYSHGANTAIAAIDAQRPRPKAEKIAGVVAYYPYCLANSKFSVPTIVLIGEKDDWTPAKLCAGIVDKTNVEVTVYPNAFHQFAAPGFDLVYLGHRLLYDPEATTDGQRRALALIGSRRE